MTSQYHIYLNQYVDDTMCVTCGDEEADPDSLEGECVFCMEDEDE